MVFTLWESARFYVNFAISLLFYTIIGASVSTIWRRQVQLGVETRNAKRRKQITRAELKQTITSLQETNPEVGIIMIEGQLQANGMYSPRSEISEVLLEINPLGGVLRWYNQLPRVQYKVAGYLMLNKRNLNNFASMKNCLRSTLVIILIIQ